MRKAHVILLAALTTPAYATNPIDTINFDSAQSGFAIDDQYLTGFNVGTRYFIGNGSQGSSTAATTTSAFALLSEQAISPDNVLVPTDQGTNEDLWVFFYNNSAQRRTVTRIGITNNNGGNPDNIYIEGIGSLGNSLGRTLIQGGGNTGSFTAGNIYAAKIYGTTAGALGVDDFTVQTALIGDTDFSGNVNEADFTTLAFNFGGSGKTWEQGDFNGDHIVNSLDFNGLAANFGQSGAGGQPAFGSVVPEPSTIVSVALFATGAAVRRRRRAR